MLDTPVDAWYLWLGLAAASAVALGVAVELPTRPPPDAAGPATAVDAVAVSQHATATRALAADAVRLGPHRIDLRGPGGTSHATLAYGPVTPAPEGSALDRVLHGERPAVVFERPAALRRAAAGARNRTRTWRRGVDRLVVRHVTWEEVDVTLVGT